MTVATEALQRLELFAGLPPDVLARIAPMAAEERNPDGTLLFSEGASAKSLFLVLEGRISLEKRVQLGRTGTPRRASIEIVGPGHAVGWSSLVAPHEYTSSGICQGETMVLVISGERLRRLMAEEPAAGYLILQRVASIIRERLTSSTATLTYFLSVVSHELKRPLAAVENYLQVMLGGFSGELDEKQRRLIERSALRLSDLRALISDMLDFARMQPEQIRADLEWVDPLQIGAEAIEEVRLAARQKDIHLKAIGPTQYRPIVAAKRRLRQVVSNLLANAVKFSPEGSTVTLSARDEPDALVVEVSDEGIGIPPDDQPHIFDDFFRGGNAGDVGGAGLGLSIAKKIVEAHHGRIEVKSPYHPGKSGAKFSVTIPRTLTLPSQGGPPGNVALQSARQTSDGTVPVS